MAQTIKTEYGHAVCNRYEVEIRRECDKMVIVQVIEKLDHFPNKVYYADCSWGLNRDLQSEAESIAKNLPKWYLDVDEDHCMWVEFSNRFDLLATD
jgi:hypothetical protein